jgi:short-subunit dehydrogenase
MSATYLVDFGQFRSISVDFGRLWSTLVDLPQLRKTGDNPTIGILLCKKKNKITDKYALESMLEKTQDIFGTVDGVVNNAGIIHRFQKINDIDFGVVEKVMNVNFYGTLNVCKVILPHLLARPEAHIVNVSSMGGFLPTAGQGIYCASKAAVKSLSEGLCAELSDTGVHISVAFPGAMFTDIKNNSGLGELSQEDKEKSKTVLHPRRAAEIIIRGIECNRKRIYVGNDAKTMNFLYRLTPGFAVKMIYKKIQYNF